MANNSFTISAALDISGIKSSAEKMQKILDGIKFPTLKAGAEQEMSKLGDALKALETYTGQMDLGQALGTADLKKATQAYADIERHIGNVHNFFDGLSKSNFNSDEVRAMSTQYDQLLNKVSQAKALLYGRRSDLLTLANPNYNQVTVNSLLTGHKSLKQFSDDIDKVFKMEMSPEDLVNKLNSRMSSLGQAYFNKTHNALTADSPYFKMDPKVLQDQAAALDALTQSIAAFFQTTTKGIGNQAVDFEASILNGLENVWKASGHKSFGQTDFMRKFYADYLSGKDTEDQFRARVAGWHQKDPYHNAMVQGAEDLIAAHNGTYQAPQVSITTNVGDAYRQQVADVTQYIRDADDELNKFNTDLSNLGVQGKGIGAAFRGGTSQITAFNDQLRLANQQTNQFESRIAYFFSLTSALNLLKRTAKSAFDNIQKLDKAMTATAVVTNFSVQDMWNQLDQYTALANELGATTQGAYETMTLFYQQGLNSEQAFALGTEAMKMAKIAGLDYAESTNLMTAALRGFNMEINEASGQRVNDVYSKLAAITAADTEEIATAMTKTASIANSAGMSFENTSAFLTQIIETTRESAETAGTALKTVIARFSEVKQLYSKGQLTGTDEEGEVIDINKIDTALKTVGLSLNQFILGNEGLDSIFLQLAEKWNTLDTATQRYIATQAAGSRQQSRFIAMMSNYERTLELATAAENAQGASQQQFEKTLDSLEAKLNTLSNSWNEFTMGIANSSMIKSGVDNLTGLLNIINKITSAAGSGFSTLSKVGIGAGLFGSIGSAIATRRGIKNVLPSITDKQILAQFGADVTKLTDDQAKEALKYQNPAQVEMARQKAAKNLYKDVQSQKALRSQRGTQVGIGLSAGFGAVSLVTGLMAQSQQKRGTATQEQVAGLQKISDTASVAAGSIGLLTTAMRSLGVASSIMIPIAVIAGITAAFTAWVGYMDELNISTAEVSDKWGDIANASTKSIDTLKGSYDSALQQAERYYELQQKITGLKPGSFEHNLVLTEMQALQQAGEMYGFIQNGVYSSAGVEKMQKTLAEQAEMLTIGNEFSKYTRQYFDKTTLTIQEFEKAGFNATGIFESTQQDSVDSFINAISSANLQNEEELTLLLTYMRDGFDANTSTFRVGKNRQTELQSIALNARRTASRGDSIIENARRALAPDDDSDFNFLKEFIKEDNFDDLFQQASRAVLIGLSSSFKDIAVNAIDPSVAKDIFDSASDSMRQLLTGENKELFDASVLTDDVKTRRREDLSTLTGQTLAQIDYTYGDEEQIVGALQAAMSRAMLLDKNFTLEALESGTYSIDYNTIYGKILKDYNERFTANEKTFVDNISQLNGEQITHFMSASANLQEYQDSIVSSVQSGYNNVLTAAVDSLRSYIDVEQLDWLTSDNISRLSQNQVRSSTGTIQMYGENYGTSMAETVNKIFESFKFDGKLFDEFLDNLDGVLSTNSISFLTNLNKAQNAINISEEVANGYDAMARQFKTGNYQTRLFQDLYNSESFADNLKALTKLQKKNGKLTTADIYESADGTDLLTDYLNLDVTSASTLAEILNSINLGDIGLNEVTEGLINAYNAAYRLEDTTAKINNSLKEWKKNIPSEGTIYSDTLATAAKGVSTELNNNRFGSEELQYSLDYFGLGKAYQQFAAQNANNGDFKKLFYDQFGIVINTLTQVEQGNLQSLFANMGSLVKRISYEENGETITGQEWLGGLQQYLTFDTTTGTILIKPDQSFADLVNQLTKAGPLGEALYGALLNGSPTFRMRAQSAEAVEGARSLAGEQLVTTKQVQDFKQATQGKVLSEDLEEYNRLLGSIVAYVKPNVTEFAFKSLSEVDVTDWLKSTLGLNDKTFDTVFANLINPDNSLNYDVLNTGLSQLGYDFSEVTSIISGLETNGIKVETLEQYNSNDAIQSAGNKIVTAINALGLILTNKYSEWDAAFEAAEKASTEIAAQNKTEGSTDYGTAPILKYTFNGRGYESIEEMEAEAKRLERFATRPERDFADTEIENIGGLAIKFNPNPGQDKVQRQSAASTAQALRQYINQVRRDEQVSISNADEVTIDKVQSSDISLAENATAPTGDITTSESIVPYSITKYVQPLEKLKETFDALAEASTAANEKISKSYKDVISSAEDYISTQEKLGEAAFNTLEYYKQYQAHQDSILIGQQNGAVDALGIYDERMATFAAAAANEFANTQTRGAAATAYANQVKSLEISADQLTKLGANFEELTKQGNDAGQIQSIVNQIVTAVGSYENYGALEQEVLRQFNSTDIASSILRQIYQNGELKSFWSLAQNTNQARSNVQINPADFVRTGNAVWDQIVASEVDTAWLTKRVQTATEALSENDKWQALLNKDNAELDDERRKYVKQFTGLSDEILNDLNSQQLIGMLTNSVIDLYLKVGDISLDQIQTALENGVEGSLLGFQSNTGFAGLLRSFQFLTQVQQKYVSDFSKVSRNNISSAFYGQRRDAILEKYDQSVATARESATAKLNPANVNTAWLSDVDNFTIEEIGKTSDLFLNLAEQFGPELTNSIVDSLTDATFNIPAFLEEWNERIDDSNIITTFRSIQKESIRATALNNAYASTWTQIENTLSSAPKSDFIAALVADDSFSSTLDNLTGIVEQTGKLDASSILDAADNCEVLNSMLEAGIISSQALADILAGIAAGKLDASGLTDGLIDAYNIADQVSSYIADSMRNLERWQKNRPDSTSAFEDYFAEVANNIKEAVNNGWLGDEAFLYDLDFLNLGEEWRDWAATLPDNMNVKQFEGELKKQWGDLFTAIGNIVKDGGWEVWQNLDTFFKYNTTGPNGQPSNIGSIKGELEAAGFSVRKDGSVELSHGQNGAVDFDTITKTFGKLGQFGDALLNMYLNNSPDARVKYDDWAVNQGLNKFEESGFYTDAQLQAYRDSQYGKLSSAGRAEFDKAMAGLAANAWSINDHQLGSIKTDSAAALQESLGLNDATFSQLFKGIANSEGKLNIQALNQGLTALGYTATEIGTWMSDQNGYDFFDPENQAVIGSIDAATAALNALQASISTLVDNFVDNEREKKPHEPVTTETTTETDENLSDAGTSLEGAATSVGGAAGNLGTAAGSVEGAAGALSSSSGAVSSGGSALSGAAGILVGAAVTLGSAAAHLFSLHLPAARTGKKGSSKFAIPGYASGRSIPRLGKINTTPPRDYEGVAQVGEAGPELIVGPNGTYVAGIHGQTFTYLNKDDTVYTAEQTKKILGDNTRAIPGFQTGKNNVEIPGFYAGPGGPRIGGDGGSGKEEDDKEWENKYDRLYNLIADIDRLAYEQKALQTNLDIINSKLSDIKDIERGRLEYANAMANYDAQREINQQQFNKAVIEANLALEAIREIEQQNDKYMKYAYYDEEMNAVRIDYGRLEALKDPEVGKEVEDYIKDLETYAGYIEDAEDAQRQAEQDFISVLEDQNKLQAEWAKKYIDFQSSVKDALVDLRQDAIDELSDLSDVQNDNNQKILDNMQKVIDEQRKLRDLQESKEDLEKTQRQLALLRRDSSGANAVEIKKLEESIKDSQQSYVDSLVDYSLEELRDSNDEAAEQRQQQIDLQQKILDWQEESGYFWPQVNALMQAAYESGDYTNSALAFIMRESDNFNGMSEAERNAYLNKWLTEYTDAMKGEEAAYSTIDYTSEIDSLNKNVEDIAEYAYYYWSKTNIKYSDLEDEGKRAAIVEQFVKELQKLNDNMEKEITTGEQGKEFKKAQANGSDYTKLILLGNKIAAGEGIVNFTDYLIELGQALTDISDKSHDYSKIWQGAGMWDGPNSSSGKSSGSSGGSSGGSGSRSSGSGSKTNDPEQSHGSTENPIGIVTYKRDGDYIEFSDDKGRVLQRAKANDAGKVQEAIEAASAHNSEIIKVAQQGIKQYATGGLATTTGLAWLDGTKSKPELVLNPSDTKNFLAIADTLRDLDNASLGSGTTYYEVHIDVDKLSSDYDVEQVASKVKSMIVSDASYRNNNVISFIR